MDAELKAKWIEALRGEKYRQGQSVLRDGLNRFCCLGVLYDISGGQWSERPEAHSNAHTTAKGNDIYLFNECKWLPTKTQRQLGKMNDEGKSFAEIADYIEANL